MFEYKIITAMRPETLAQDINDLVKEKYSLETLITTPLNTEVHYTAILKRNNYLSRNS